MIRIRPPLFALALCLLVCGCESTLTSTLDDGGLADGVPIDGASSATLDSSTSTIVDMESIPRDVTVQSDMAVAELDMAVAELDMVVVEPDMAAAELDVAVAELDVAVVEPDMAAAELDVAVAELDVAVVEPDMAVAELDVAVAELDMVVAEPDMAAAELDMAAAEPDMAAAELDMAAAEPDMAAAEPDMAAVEPDMAARLPSFPELAIGPYGDGVSTLTLNLLSQMRNLDVNETYSQSAAQGYVLQALGEFLSAARNYDLERRDELIRAGLAEIEELRTGAELALGGGPAFGLPDAWDAFGDGSENPARTPYTWQSGMVALGVAKFAQFLVQTDHPEAGAVRQFGVDLVEYWRPYYTAVDDGGWYWYSDRISDAIAVHNTSVLVAMAALILTENGAPEAVGDRARACADLLWARMRGNPVIGYAWNYADDGLDPARRRPEDISHAAITLQFMRFAADRGWWAPNRMRGVAQTLTQNIWSGNPARLNSRVDGAPGGDEAWRWTRSAVNGFAAHGDSPGGDPIVFEYARSIFFSSYLSRFNRRVGAVSLDSTRTLALALMLTRRPRAFADGSRWEMVAGDEGDDALPEAPGGVRFYTVEWDDPAETVAGQISLPARQANTGTANVLIDLPDDYLGRVAVSLIYRGRGAGLAQEWDGDQYHDLAHLPATTDENGDLRWSRVTFELMPEIRFDYQARIRGRNVLLQLTNSAALHRIEATPLD